MNIRPEYPDINHLLHELRGQALERLEFGAEHLVSVGCAGRWYFDWIEERFGKVAHHTGVEFYSPRPEDLPSNCSWIANTAGNMPEIFDASADVVISGQNLEHLWPDEVTGFFLESHRILKDGGKLIIDSPNRLVTRAIGWSHPEHTVEFSPDEAVELCTLAGLEVEKIEGIWLTIDPETKHPLPFEEMSRFGPWPQHKRTSAALGDPENSFIWWIVAAKTERKPDPEKLSKRMSEIFAAAWPERLARTKTLIGKDSSDGKWMSSQGATGVLLFGPYTPLKKGSYSATFLIRVAKIPEDTQRILCSCDVVGGDPLEVFHQREVAGADLLPDLENEISLPFVLDKTTFGIQFRMITQQPVEIYCAREVRLDAAATEDAASCANPEDRNLPTP